MAFKIVLSEMSIVVIVSLKSLSGKSGIGSAPSNSKTLATNLFNRPAFWLLSFVRVPHGSFSWLKLVLVFKLDLT